MLRGNYTVRMDEKGRIKLPAAYRRYIDENYGAEFYVTSLTGECARLYPMREWLAIEEKLQSRGTMDAAVRKFLDRTNYYGQLADMDAQGRILVHPAVALKSRTGRRRSSARIFAVSRSMGTGQIHGSNGRRALHGR